MRNQHLRNLIFTGLMVAIGIILNQFVSIYYPPSTTIIKFGIGYLPIILVGLLFGPIYGVLSAVAFDLIGYAIWGVNTGPFYFGFTFNAMLYGFVPGLIAKIKTSKLPIFSTINIVFTGILVVTSVFVLFNIDSISTNINFTNTMRYIIGSIALVVSLLLLAFVIWKRKESEENHRLIFSFLLVHIATTIFLTPLWVSNLYGIPYTPQLPLRIAKFPVEAFIYIVLLIQLYKILKPRLNNK
ncbi:MAG: folate family ECF transporter S component [Bacilli bacterium]|nr:folate family ECF transporter S component [Bacilli bacterium]MBN2876027.1 folate family ECF transporter S component [Bacilli bacterium]